MQLVRLGLPLWPDVQRHFKYSICETAGEMKSSPADVGMPFILQYHALRSQLSLKLSSTVLLGTPVGQQRDCWQGSLTKLVRPIGCQ